MALSLNGGTGIFQANPLAPCDKLRVGSVVLSAEHFTSNSTALNCTVLYGGNEYETVGDKMQPL